MKSQTSFKFMSHGGRRKGAGRRRLRLHDPEHVARPRIHSRIPFHVTLRFDQAVPNLRNEKFLLRFTEAIKKGRKKGLDINHFTIESTHIHFMGETESNETLRRGMLSIQGCLVWALKKLFAYFGRVFQGRYHLHELKTPREVRHALLYVIFNHAKHCQTGWFADAFSSAHAFKELREFVRSPGRSPRWQERIDQALAPAKSWLQTVGWRRGRRSEKN
jgi:putative transposase